MPIDFTFRLPRILGRYVTISCVPAPRSAHEAPLYAQRVPGGLEARLGASLLYVEAWPDRR